MSAHEDFINLQKQVDEVVAAEARRQAGIEAFMDAIVREPHAECVEPYFYAVIVANVHADDPTSAHLYDVAMEGSKLLEDPRLTSE